MYATTLSCDLCVCVFSMATTELHTAWLNGFHGDQSLNLKVHTYCAAILRGKESLLALS